MPTDAAVQVAAAIPTTLPAAGATPFGQAAIDRAMRASAAKPAVVAPAAAAPEAPPAPVVPAPPEPTAGELADKALAAANTITAKRRAQVDREAAAEQRATEAEARATAAETARKETERRATEAEAKAKLLSDPVAAARAAVEENSPEGRLAKLEAEQSADRKRREEEATAAREASTRDVVARGRAAYVAAAQEKTGDVEAFPNLARLAKRNARALVIQAEAINEEYRARTGSYASLPELRKYQEWLYTPEGEAATEAAAAPPDAPVTPSAVAKPKPAAAARTLAARTAGAATLPKSFDEMTPAEMRSAMVEQFKAKGRTA